MMIVFAGGAPLQWRVMAFSQHARKTRHWSWRAPSESPSEAIKLTAHSVALIS